MKVPTGFKTFVFILQFLSEEYFFLRKISDGSLDPNALPNQRERIGFGNIKVKGIVLLVRIILHYHSGWHCIEVS